MTGNIFRACCKAFVERQDNGGSWLGGRPACIDAAIKELQLVDGVSDLLIVEQVVSSQAIREASDSVQRLPYTDVLQL